MKYDSFIFDSYSFDPSTKRLILRYGFDDQVSYCETYTFDFDFVAYDEAVLDRALQLLFFTAGVSYYKTYLANTIQIKSGSLDSATAAFVQDMWQKGLGEFWYVNKLDPRTTIPFTSNTKSMLTLAHNGSGTLVGVGGGKDSLVSIEKLRSTDADIATWSVGHRAQLEPLVERIGLPHYWIERTIDPKLIATRNDPTAYNGHIPISAIFAAVGCVVAALTGRRDVVVSNEQSANEPTLQYQGIAINHQYSKSQEFEKNFQAALLHHFGQTIRYYSLLRPYSELRIAELFTPYFDTYKDVFSSCNRAFTQDSRHLSWCGQCPKCAFVALVFAPFIDKKSLSTLWSGTFPLLDPALHGTYEQLLGISGNKPLECVGEIRESRAAMRMAQALYPELSTYVFDLPTDYDFRSLATDEIPQDIRKSLTF